MQLEEFFDYKNQLMNDLLSNEEIVRLLADDCKPVNDVQDLIYKQVFPYEYIPETIEHGQTFICCDVDIQKSVNKTFLIPVLYIWVFSHKSKLRLPKETGGGIRTDKLCSEIAKAVNGSRYYGLGELDLYAVKRFAPITDYQGKVLTFQAKDFNRTLPTGKPVPTVGEVLENEDNYYSMVSMLTAMPIDMMVQLDDIGIDFTTINEWELFLLLFNSLKEQDTSLIFGDFDLKPFQPAINPQNGNVILVNKATGVRIDRALHGQIAAALRKIHHLEKDNRKPANGEAREYMIERMRKKLRRRGMRTTDSQLEELIVALVNTEQYHYGFEGTRELSIYQFNESVRQVIKKIDYDNKMHGIYAGTVSAKDLSQDDLNWLTHK